MKILLSIISLIYCLNISSQIKPICSIEIGQSDKVVRMFDDKNYKDANFIDKSGQYADIKIGAKYNRLTLSSNTKTYMNYNGDKGFSPWLSVYDISLEYKTKKLTIGAFHSCSHFTQSNQSYGFVYSNVEDRIYVRVDLF